jgi:hypothetical protein
VAAGLALFLWPGVAPSLALGFEENQRQLISWYREMVHPFVVEGKVTSEHSNQSLPGVAFRLLTRSPSFTEYGRDGNPSGHEYHNLVDLDPSAVRWLLKGGMALFALLAVWTCRAPTQPRGGWRLAAEFALVTLGMLLFSERTWKHHCVTLLLPFAVLCYYLATRPTGWGLRAYLGGSLAAAAALMLLASTGPNDGGGHGASAFGKLAQVYGVYVMAYGVLVAALAAALRTSENANAAAPPRDEAARAA